MEGVSQVLSDSGGGRGVLAAGRTPRCRKDGCIARSGSRAGKLGCAGAGVHTSRGVSMWPAQSWAHEGACREGWEEEEDLAVLLRSSFVVWGTGDGRHIIRTLQREKSFLHYWRRRWREETPVSGRNPSKVSDKGLVPCLPQVVRPRNSPGNC